MHAVAKYALGTTLLMGVVAIADWLTSALTSVASLYVAAVLLALWEPSRVGFIATLASVLIVGVFVAHHPEFTAWSAEILSHRAVALAGVWIVALTIGIFDRGRRFQHQMEQETLHRTLRDLQDFKYALDQSAIVAIADKRGIIRYVNDMFCRIAKYSREELIGQDHRIINSKFHSHDFMKELWRTIGRGHVWRGEIRNRAKDGTLYWVDTTIVPFLDEHGKPYQYIAIRYDITGRKELEAKVREQESLTRLGEMAAIIAHEVRNPLAGIRGAIQVIQSTLPPNTPELEILAEVVSRIDGLNSLVQDLLQFSRPAPPQRAPMSVMAMLQATISLLRRDPSWSEFEVRIEGDDVTIEADEKLLTNVMANLLLNAAYAMSGKGQAQIAVTTAPDKVLIELRDRGSGIPDAVQQRLFEPFFTTKHRGTGLGLAIAKRTILAHGGDIRIESKVGEGTTVFIRLPLA